MYNKEQLKELINIHLEQKLITVKRSTKYPGLRVVKYAKRCFYDNIWNDFLKECRGLVIDDDYNVIVYPMTKIFNYGENGWFPDITTDTNITAYRKYNGFLGCVTYHSDYGVIYSTTGSLDSKYCDMIEESIDTQHTLKALRPDCHVTLYFEICHPDDPHIIKEEHPYYFLGLRDKDGYTPDTLNGGVTTLNVLFSSDVRHEGWVCHTDKGEVFKIKTPHYLRTKFFARANINKLEQVLKHGSTKNEDYLSNFDEDLYTIVDYVKIHKDSFMLMDEQERINFINEGMSYGVR